MGIRPIGVLAGSCALVVGFIACGGGSSGGYLPVDAGIDGNSGTGGNAGSATGGSAGSATGGSAGSTGGSAGSTGGSAGSTGGSAGGSGCDSGPNDDQDGDGFTVTQGDCNDCDAKVNPGAIEVATASGGTPVDDDCDGSVDNLPAACDTALALDAADPLDAARAIELCKSSTDPKQWGVTSAKWTMADGSTPTLSANYHLGHGLLSGFGANVSVQKGSRLLGLSSGTARQPSDPGYQSPSGFDKAITGSAPQGYPKESPACPGVVTGTPHDPVALEVSLRTPTNAVGFSFDFKFYTYEWPAYICSQYNDFFLALVNPVPTGLKDGNVSFDAENNPFSVNSSLLEVCTCSPAPPCTAGGKTFPCTLGANELIGTGFEEHGATGWLKTSVPVQGGSQVTIRFTVYDSGDGVLDSTTLIDNFSWLTDSAPSSPTTTAK